MGDLSTEPSMEDILSSIKRIIAEEGDQPVRRARPARAAPVVPVDDPVEDEVLELSDPMPTPCVTARAWPDPVESPSRVGESAHAPDAIVSTEAAAASRGALDSLSRLLVKPEPGSDGTLEGMVREMLRPMLREWLDAHLPAMVEAMVSREIARIAGQAS